MKKAIIFGILAVVLLSAIFFVLYFLQEKVVRTIPKNESNLEIQDRIISFDELRAEMENVNRINAYSKNISQKDYPRVLGKYSENGLVLVEIFYCSDVCPEYGGVYIVFHNITSKEECAKVGGEDLISPAWRGYIGCAPKIVE